MNSILVWVEHHPAITALITAIVIGIVGVVGWAINYFKKREAVISSQPVSAGRDIITAEGDIILGSNSNLESKASDEFKPLLKEFILFLDEFGNNLFLTDTYSEFMLEMKIYKEMFRKIFAGLRNEDTILEGIKGIYDSIQSFLNQRLELDGGQSRAQQIKHINNCKKYTDQVLRIIDGGGD